MKTVLLLGGPAAGQRVEVHGTMRSTTAEGVIYQVVPLCSHGEVHWFGVLDGADPLALLIAGYGVSAAPKAEPSDAQKFEAYAKADIEAVAALREQDRMRRNDERFRKLHSHLLGYVENGGGDHVSIQQDDATGEFVLTINPGRPSRRAFYSSSLESVFDRAIETEGDKS